jgi:hypothetical protein
MVVGFPMETEKHYLLYTTWNLIVDAVLSLESLLVESSSRQ